MTEVIFIARFQEHRKGDKAKMSKKDVEKYVNRFAVAKVVKPRKTKKIDAAPKTKQVIGADNK